MNLILKHLEKEWDYLERETMPKLYPSEHKIINGHRLSLLYPFQTKALARAKFLEMRKASPYLIKRHYIWKSTAKGTQAKYWLYLG